MPSPLTADRLIEWLELEPLPIEGGYFRQTYRSEESLSPEFLPARYPREKPISTAIYYLLTAEPDSFSALHRLPTDEIYHFYLGDPVEMLLLYPDGTDRLLVLGSDLLSGHRIQWVVPRGVYQGARLRKGGRYALLGTTMAPGFDPADYEAGDRKGLSRRHPKRARQIELLTRS